MIEHDDAGPAGFDLEVAGLDPQEQLAVQGPASDPGGRPVVVAVSHHEQPAAGEDQVRTDDRDMALDALVRLEGGGHCIPDADRQVVTRIPRVGVFGMSSLVRARPDCKQSGLPRDRFRYPAQRRLRPDGDPPSLKGRWSLHSAHRPRTVSLTCVGYRPLSLPISMMVGGAGDAWESSWTQEPGPGCSTNCRTPSADSAASSRSRDGTTGMVAAERHAIERALDRYVAASDAIARFAEGILSRSAPRPRR